MGTLTRQMCVCAAASLVASAASCSAASPSAPSPASGTALARRIVVLGDSLAVAPNSRESFPAVLQDRLDASTSGWAVVNAGVNGDTTAGGLARFDAVVGTGADVLVLELGANDGLRGVDVRIVERNLGEMIARAQERGMRVLLCGMETPPTNGWDYTLAFHAVFPRVAARYKVPLVPFLLEGVALDPAMNGPDRIHPNAAGARRIADTIWPYLQPLLSPAASSTRQPVGAAGGDVRS
jgi:acyl-CoA thioesterase-1